MYKLTHTDTILRITDGASIPSDASNTDYREYLKWRDGWTQEITQPKQVTTLVDREPDETHETAWQEEVISWEMEIVDTIIHAPNTPEPADPLPEPIYTASAASFRRALRRLNLREAVETAIQNSGNGELIDMWEYETTLHSNNTHLVAFAESLNISDKIEQVFILANSLDS